MTGATTSAFASLIFAATTLGACASAPVELHKGDRIANPNRIAAGQHVRILEVGEGDKQFDEGQSFKGVICSAGKNGLRNEWTDGYYEGSLEHCSNGDRSFKFQFVRVESLEKT